jgi:hypothetical protein
VGPWLLLENDDEVVNISRWGAISDTDLEEYHRSIERWGCSSVNLMLTDSQLAALIERGRRWPWKGYELRQMKEAGKYPPKPSKRPIWQM